MVLSKEHQTYAEEHKLTGGAASIWKNISNEDRDRLIYLNLNGDLSETLSGFELMTASASIADLHARKVQQDLEKQNQLKVNGAVNEKKNLPVQEIPVDQTVTPVLRKTIMATLFGFETIPKEAGALGGMVKNYFDEKAKVFKTIFFTITEVSEETEKEALKRAVLYALAPMFGIKTVPAKDQAVETYSNVIKLEYEKELKKVEDLKKTVLRSAASKLAPLTDTPVAEEEQRIEKYFPGALEAIKEDLKDLLQ